MTRHVELHAIITEAKAELREIRTADFEKWANSQVGKYFKYPSSDLSNKWWLYVFARELKDDKLRGLGFQTDPYRQVSIKLNTNLSSIGSFGWEEITREEFTKAWDKLWSMLRTARAEIEEFIY